MRKILIIILIALLFGCGYNDVEPMPGDVWNYKCSDPYRSRKNSIIITSTENGYALYKYTNEDGDGNKSRSFEYINYYYYLAEEEY